MQPFKFSSAQSVDEAIRAGGRYLAGGTNLLDLMKIHVETPSLLIDVTDLPLKTIEERGDKIWIGALVSNSDLARDPKIRASVPVLADAILAGASPQLRNKATVGGNLLQRTRCVYFRDVASACNKRDPGSGCSALGGVSRMNAILGTSDHCIAAHPSDMCVGLMTLETTIHIRNSKGVDRVLPFEEFFKKPGQTPHLETSLEPGDFIRGLEVMKPAAMKNYTYVKVRDRASYAFALTSAAVWLDIEDSVIKRARLALGGVGTVPWRARNVEIALTSKKISADLFAEASSSAAEGARTTRDNQFKVGLIRSTVLRALEQAGGLS